MWGPDHRPNVIIYPSDRLTTIRIYALPRQMMTVYARLNRPRSRNPRTKTTIHEISVTDTAHTCRPTLSREGLLDL